MKLGIIRNWDEGSFIWAAERSLDFLEFCVNAGYDVNEFCEKVPTLKEYIAKYGVSVGAVGRFGTSKLDADGNISEEETRYSCKLIDAAVELGCPVYVTGCNYVNTMSFFDNCARAIDYFSPVVEYGRKKGVKVATYNARYNNFVVCDPAWDVILNKVDGLGIKYDPANCIEHHDGNYLSETKKWGNKFYHVHLKGISMINGKFYDNPPAGLDQIDWGTFIGMLYGQSYAGGLSLEPHSGLWTGELGERGVDYSIRYFKPYIF